MQRITLSTGGHAQPSTASVPTKTTSCGKSRVLSSKIDDQLDRETGASLTLTAVVGGASENSKATEGDPPMSSPKSSSDASRGRFTGFVGSPVLEDSPLETETSGTLFRKQPYEQQMQRLTMLRLNNPDEAAKRLEQGRNLLAHAAMGDVERANEVAQMLAKEHGGAGLEWWACKMFLVACERGQVRILDWLKSKGLDPASHSGLEDAIARAVECTGRSVAGIGKLDQSNRSGASPALPVVRWLLDAGFDVNACRRGARGGAGARNEDSGAYGLTALHLACARGDYALVRLLVHAGADVNAVAANDVMPLHCARAAGRAAADFAEAAAKEYAAAANGHDGAEITGPPPMDEAEAVSRARKRALALSGQIEKLLRSKGARSSWRRDGAQSKTSTVSSACF
jgi:hypothetical protein